MEIEKEIESKLKASFRVFHGQFRFMSQLKFVLAWNLSFPADFFCWKRFFGGIIRGENGLENNNAFSFH